MGIFRDVFKRNLEIRDMLDLDLASDPATRSYLKRIALETNINFIARTISQSEFWIMNGQNKQKNNLHYRLNIRPNTDSSASDFWHKVIYKLVYDNEVLIIKSDTDDLLIADDFDRVEYAVYEDRFKDVMVKDHKFERQFMMNEVFYLTYNNEKIQRYVNELFADYGELFGRMMDSQLRKNQLRATVGIKTGAGMTDDKHINRMQKYIDSVYSRLKTESVALLPKIDGFEFDELSNGNTTTTDNGPENIHKLKKIFIEDVAKMIGIPPSLLHGDMADISNLMESYLKFCINPLIKKIEDEFNSKLFTRQEYLSGKHMKVVGLNKKDPLEHAAAIDKLIASRVLNANEARSLFGFERVEGQGLEEYVLTKNYDNRSQALKGVITNDEYDRHLR